MWGGGALNWPYCGSHSTTHVYHIIVGSPLNLYNVACQLYVNKAGQNKWVLQVEENPGLCGEQVSLNGQEAGSEEHKPQTERWLDVQNLRPHPDLQNHTLHENSVPRWVLCMVESEKPDGSVCSCVGGDGVKRAGTWSSNLALPVVCCVRMSRFLNSPGFAFTHLVQGIRKHSIMLTNCATESSCGMCCSSDCCLTNDLQIEQLTLINCPVSHRIF